jgi:hypothetical protein
LHARLAAPQPTAAQSMILLCANERMLQGGDDENSVELADCRINALGLPQQQRACAAGEEHHCGRASELGDDGGVPGWHETALHLNRVGPLNTPNLGPQLAGEYDAGTVDRERGRLEPLRHPGVAGVKR